MKDKNKKENRTWEYLKYIKDLSTLAELLELGSGAELSYTLYYMEKRGKAKYCSFKINKKNGGTRTIDAPCSKLKFIQSQLTSLLGDMTNEQEHTVMAHGFKKKYSIFTNAEVHKNKKYVLNFDIKDFFPSFNFGRVRGFFISKGVNDKVATIIAQIACYDDKAKGKHALPQGSPCSPIISNLMAHEFLDLPLMKIAQEHGCDYSRYADDITFSTNEEKFSRKIAISDSKQRGSWKISTYIENKINKRGFEINHDKTRMQYKSNQQIVTGLVVNEKVNVRRTYFKTARAMVYSLLKSNDFYIPGVISPVDITDNIADDEPQQSSSLLGKMNRLEGILNHIYNIKLQASMQEHHKLLYYDYINRMFEGDSKDDRLNHIKRFITDFLKRVKIKTDTEISKNCRAIKKLYEDFLFYKYFSFTEPNNKAIIFCEGATDVYHIKSALKKLKAKYPELIQVSLRNEKKITIYSVKFPQSSRIAGLFFNILYGKGIGYLQNIVEYYRKKSAELKLRYPNLSFGVPVIFITDSDEAASKNFFKPMVEKYPELYDNSILENNEKPYFLISKNLYAVKLPIIEANKNGDIEANKNGDIEANKNGDIEANKNGDIEANKNGDIEANKNGDIEANKNGDIEVNKNGKTDKRKNKKVVIEDLYENSCEIKKDFLVEGKIPRTKKVEFAKAVQRNIEKVNFSHFEPLLDRIDAVIKEHYEKQQKQT